MLEVLFGRRETKTTEQRVLVAKDRFQLLHVSLLRSLATVVLVMVFLQHLGLGLRQLKAYILYKI